MISFLKQKFVNILPLSIRAKIKFRKILKGPYKNWLVNDETQICITGFPRSGNTFIYHLFAIYFPDIVLAHHIHKVELFQLSIKKGLPTIILIRPPEDTISSYILLLKESNHTYTIKSVIEKYIEYYKNIHRIARKNNVLLVNFENLFNDLDISMNRILEFSNMMKPTSIDYNIKKISSKIKETNIEFFNGKEGTTYIPNRYKEKNKNKIRILLGDSKYKNQLSEAQYYYHLLETLSKT